MISISSRKVIQLLIFVLLILTLANIAVQSARFLLDRGGLWGVTRLFDINEENNIPTWYSSIQLLLCSALLGLIAAVKYQHRDRYAKQWKGLSIIFLLLSIDETSSIHELLIPTGKVIDGSGFLYFFWVVPGMLFVLSLALIYWKFLTHLPFRTRMLFLISGAIFVPGAIGMEMLGAKFFVMNSDVSFMDSASGWKGMTMALILAIEEFLEMVGVTVFLYALLSYAASELEGGKVYISKSRIN